MENLKIKYNKFIKIFLIFLMISIIIYIRYNTVFYILYYFINYEKQIQSSNLYML